VSKNEEMKNMKLTQEGVCAKWWVGKGIFGVVL
jgi:hypothetical protein